MRYQPSLPEKNDNVSHAHPLKEFFSLLFGLILIFFLVYWSLGFFIDFAVGHISPEKEALLFAKMNLNINDEAGVSSEQEAVLQDIMDSLRQCMDVSYPVTVRLIESEQANALAYPGGTVVVFTGLLERTRSENGLSFVLAHELGHYKNRDHLRLIGREIVVLALSAALTGADSDISQVLSPAKSFGQAQYSQTQESAADREALEAINCFYGHTGGATELFEALKEERSGSDLKMLHYFSSHPELQNRIDTLNKLSTDMGFQNGEVKELNIEPTSPSPEKASPTYTGEKASSGL